MAALSSVGADHSEWTLCKITEKTILIASAITAILSLVPCLRFVASLTLRSIALISTAAVFTANGAKFGIVETITNVCKIAAVILGIVAVAGAFQVVLIAALAVDIVFQFIQFIASIARVAFQGEFCPKIVAHFLMLTINVLTLVGVIMGSWPLMVSAASVAILAMIFFAIYAAVKNPCPENAIDVICYMALAAVCLTAAVTMSEISTTIKGTGYHNFKVRNPTHNYNMVLYNKDGSPIHSIRPYEEITFQHSEDTIKATFVDNNGYMLVHHYKPSVPPHDVHVYREVPSGIEGINVTVVDTYRDPGTPAQFDYYFKYGHHEYVSVIPDRVEIIQHPLPSEKFGEVPIGGLFLATAAELD